MHIEHETGFNECYLVYEVASAENDQGPLY